MVTIIVTGDNSLMKYWLPLVEKYKADAKYQILFAETQEEGMKSARFDKIFFTTYRAIPTYQTMIKLAYSNTLLTPKWHEFKHTLEAGKICLEAFCVRKDWTSDVCRDEYYKDKKTDSDCHVYCIDEY